MSEAVAAPARDHSFALRRLHSLCGIVPVGAFLFFHLFENLKIGLSPESYESAIHELWQLTTRPVFYLIEIFFLGVPILFHALYGFWVWYTGQSNTDRYRYRRNWLYTAQRWSGLVVFVYILIHVWQLRIMPGGHLALLRDDSNLTRFHEVKDAITPLGWTVFYLVGGISAAFHLGNGLFGFCYSWGLAVGRRAQAQIEALGWLVFLLLSAAVVYTVTVVHITP